MAGVGIDERALEAVEAEAYADVWQAAPPTERAALGLAARPAAGGVFLRATALGGSMTFNRLVGCGLGDEDGLEAALDGAIAEFGREGVGGWVVQVAPGATRFAALAAARGLVPHPRSWMKFVRDAGPPPVAATTLTVRPAAARDGPAFGAMVATAFGLPPALVPWVAALAGRPRWRVFLAWDGGTPVAAGALWLGDGLGWAGLGATLASHRGRGAQPAIFAARIDAGRAAGCGGFVTETGVPLAGEAAPSYRNILRAGFREAYARPNLRRPPA